MSLFDNYDNLKPINKDVPNNITPPPCPIPTSDKKIESCLPKQPFVEYNIQGEQVGYWWYQGDSVNLEFDIDGEVVIGNSEDESEGTFIPAPEYLEGKKAEVKFFNFRREEIANWKIDIERDNPDIIFNEKSVTIKVPFTSEFSKTLPRSTYTISLQVFDNFELTKTLFWQDDCSIIIK